MGFSSDSFRNAQSPETLYAWCSVLSVILKIACLDNSNITSQNYIWGSNRISAIHLMMILSQKLVREKSGNLAWANDRSPWILYSTMKWGLVSKKQIHVSRVGTSNYILQILWDVIISPWPCHAPVSCHFWQRILNESHYGEWRVHILKVRCWYNEHQYIGYGAKWLTICKWYFQEHFLERKVWNFD